MLFTFPPPPPLLPYLSIPIILSVSLKTLSIHLKSARAVEVVFPAWSVNFLDFFLAACRKVFRKASLRLWRNKSHDWQSLPSSSMVPYFVSFWLNWWNTDCSGWRRKGITLRTSLWTVTSLWPQKVSCSSRIYSARAKLKLISDQAGLYASLFGILNKSTVSGKFTRDDLCGGSASYWARVS